MKIKNEEIKSAAIHVLSGLLASGHYTVQQDANDDTPPFRMDNGENFKEGFNQRFSFVAVEHAIEIAEQLIKDINSQYPNE